MCDVLSDHANGGAVTFGTAVGDTAVYYCDYGYDLIGDGTVTCQSSGNWSGSLPICEGLYHLTSIKIFLQVLRHCIK